jgi:RNA polymerase sigma-70 factor (ECF subfamily)
MSAAPAEIAASYDAGRQAWPELGLEFEKFREHVARLGVVGEALSVHARDLFLVAAVLAGEARALAALDRDYLRVACTTAGRIDRTPQFAQDVEQQLRLKLLAGAEPGLRLYAAAGGLLPWLRVSALRVAINLKRSDHLVPAAGSTLEPLIASNDVERDAARGLYLEHFQRAVEASFHRLSPRERTLMQLHFVDGLNIEAIGVMYGAHRATVARWLAAIRRTIFEETRALLGQTSPPGSDTIRSLYRLLEPDLHLTLSRLLESQPRRAGTTASY